jgi:cytoskeleton protein RodZ
LESHRKQSGVSLESIADSTKISSRFLRAIESEEFEKLPGGVFDTNYIRQYATAVGFSEQTLLEVYRGRMAAAEEELQPRPAPVRRRGFWASLTALISYSPIQRV